MSGAPSEMSTPAFIVGSRRSGTTLVSRIIDAHPAFSIYHESFLFPIFSDELRWYGDLRVPRNIERLVDDVREMLSTQIADVPARPEILAAIAQPTLSGVLGALLTLYARSRGKRRGGDKTPEHHRYLDVILRDFPESPVVFTIRDPRDTVFSIRRVFDTSIEGAAHRWREAYNAYRAHAGRVSLVRYESLANEPRIEIQRLCHVLGEQFEPGMLEFHRNTGGEFQRLGGEKLSSPIDRGSIGLFRSMPEHDLRTIEAICAEGMESAGYPFVASTRGAAAARAHSSPAASVSVVPPATAPARSDAPLPTWRWIVDRFRYYGLHRRRWVRGAARWKIMARVRLHWLVGQLPRRA